VLANQAMRRQLMPLEKASRKTAESPGTKGGTQQSGEIL